MANSNMRWIFLAIAGILLITTMGKTPTQSVAELDTIQCTKDEDCPCWGEYVVNPLTNESAYGIGIAKCGDDGTCDVAYCVDMESIGEWARDNPWAYLKSHPMFLLIISALVLMAIFWESKRKPIRQ